MNAGSLQELHDLGQSLWLDDLSRDLIASGTLERYIDRFCVTGLTSNPSIFDQAIGNGTAHDDPIRASDPGLKDPAAPDVLYLEALAAPFTINTVPDKTLEAFADHGKVGDLMPRNGGDAATVLDGFANASIDVQALAAQLQSDGAEAFDRSWDDLLACTESKRTGVKSS